MANSNPFGIQNPAFSVLKYNGIELQLSKLLLFEQQAVYDESGTDYLYTVIRLKVRAVVNPQGVAYDDYPPAAPADGGGSAYLPGQVPAGQAITPVLTVDAIRHALLQPRKQLIYTVDQQVLVLSPPPTTNYATHPWPFQPITSAPVDEANGPRPIRLDLAEVNGARTILAEYTIETALRFCAEPGASQVGHLGIATRENGILSNRWRQSHDVDEVQYATITTDGVAIFSNAAMAVAGKVADSLRGVCLPKVPRGFRRVGVTWTVAPADNAATYRVVDREQPVDIGSIALRAYGVVRFAAEVVTSTQLPSEKQVTSVWTLQSFHGVVEGNRQSKKEAMIQWLIALAYERLQLKTIPADTDPKMSSQVVKEILGEKRVELQITTFRPTPTDVKDLQDAWVEEALSAFKSKVGTNPQLPNDDNSRGPFRGLAVAQALIDACQDPKVPSKLGLGKKGDDDAIYAETSDDAFEAGFAANSATVSQTIFGVPGIGTALISVGPLGAGSTLNNKKWHTDWKLTTTVDHDENRIVLPVMAKTWQPQEVVRVAQPMTRVTVDWTAERVSNAGVKPTIPTPYVTTPEFALLSHRITGEAITPMGDGISYAYRISGVYTYSVAKPVGVAGPAEPTALSFALGAMPNTVVDYGEPQAAFAPADFQHGIIDKKGSATVPMSTKGQNT